MTFQDDIARVRAAFQTQKPDEFNHKIYPAWAEDLAAFDRIAAVAGRGQALIDGMAWRRLEDAPNGVVPEGAVFGGRYPDGSWGVSAPRTSYRGADTARSDGWTHWRLPPPPPPFPPPEPPPAEEGA